MDSDSNCPPAERPTPGCLSQLFILDSIYWFRKYYKLISYTDSAQLIMGKKLSVVKGVKSEDYTEPGNAVNQIWVGDTELISRLPFGDNDMEQAGWPVHGVPKIPWHNFIIPMRRDLGTPSITNSSPPLDLSDIVPQIPPNQTICCHQGGCIADQRITNTIFTSQLVAQDDSQFIFAINLMIWAYMALTLWRETRRSVMVLPFSTCIHIQNSTDPLAVAGTAAITTMFNACALVLGWSAILALDEARRVYQFQTDDWGALRSLAMFMLITQMMVTVWTTMMDWLDVWRVLRRRCEIPVGMTINIRNESPYYSPQKPSAALV
ncbi:hypothetical protein BDW74DRAFT_122438 [Aspergillus multicolor]|uniref:uncharacterized protein n=1 Tax=Aspergillus multicolor TaxID=41759 RepID=UPI003CCDEE7E